MKKIALIVVLAITFTCCKTIKHGKFSMLNIGGTEIKIPAPINTYKVLNLTKINTPYNIIPPFQKATTAFVETSNNNRRSFNKIVDDSIQRFALVGYLPWVEKEIWDEARFLLNKKYSTKYIITNKEVILNTIYPYYYDSLNLRDLNSTTYPFEFGVIYDIKDAYGIICGNFISLEKDTLKLIAVKSSIKIKNKILETIIYCNYNGDESIEWVSSISEAWAKAILDANK